MVRPLVYPLYYTRIISVRNLQPIVAMTLTSNINAYILYLNYLKVLNNWDYYISK